MTAIEQGSSRRDQVLEGMRNKKMRSRQFMPLCFFDFFDTLPGFSELSHDIVQKADGSWGCEELEYRLEFFASIGATYMDWCCDKANSNHHDKSVKIARPVVRKVDQQAPNHFTSDCPMAATHIANLSEKIEQAEHPMTLLRMAYGL